MTRRPAGATLIELMVSSALGLLVVAAVGSLFLASSRAQRQDERLSFMNQELGFAIAQLVQDIEMAGHWARLHDPSRAELHGNLAVAQDCGAGSTPWTFADRRPLSIVDNATGAAANAVHQCLPAAEVSAGSDVLAIKGVASRVAGTDLDMSGQTPGAVYLRTGNLSGRLYLHNGAALGEVPPPFENREYRPAIYYVQPSVDGLSEPALCRRVLRATGVGSPPAFVAECLAQGVEVLQLEAGIDTDDDGAANFFASSPAGGAAVVSVRLFLLARSSRPDFNHREASGKTYMFSNMEDPHEPAANSADPADRHYYHKTLSTEIVLRNPRTLQGVAIQ